MSHSIKSGLFNRRRFLCVGGLSLLGGMTILNQSLVGSAVANPLLDSTPSATSTINTGRGLNLHNLHTGEKLNCTFWSEGSYNTDALSAINQLLRDHRTGDIHAIDPSLLDFMNTIACDLRVEPTFHVISGFRSERTNQALRNQGRQVASKSYHRLGQAVDIRMPGVDVVQLHKAALALERGGVGLYRGQDFIHIDTGPLRRW